MHVEKAHRDGQDGIPRCGWRNWLAERIAVTLRKEFCRSHEVKYVLRSAMAVAPLAPEELRRASEVAFERTPKSA